MLCYTVPVMADTAPVKKTTRRKTSATADSPTEPAVVTASPRNVKVVSQLFTDLLSTIAEDKTSFETLQKEIIEIRESWIKEQARHEEEMRQRDLQEELEHRREREAYEYELAKTRRQAQDEFAEQRAKWEKELQERKEELAKDKVEVETLRKQVAGFETVVAKAVKEAKEELARDLTDQFGTERKLREQEVKAEKEILVLKIQNLTQESERQAREVEILKRALDVATAQLKEIAVKVIESSGSPKPQTSLES